MNRGKAILIAFDQLVNTLVGGWPDETLSSRAYRLAIEGMTPGTLSARWSVS